MKTRDNLDLLFSFSNAMRPGELTNVAWPELRATSVIFPVVDHLRRVVAEDLEYYHHERNYQELAGRIIEPETEIGTSSGKVCRRQRLGECEGKKRTLSTREDRFEPDVELVSVRASPQMRAMRRSD